MVNIMLHRKVWTYRGCTITPQKGESRYFGHPDFVPDTRCPQYYTNWWNIDFPDGTYCLAARKSTCRSYIDEQIYRRADKVMAIPMGD